MALMGMLIVAFIGMMEPVSFTHAASDGTVELYSNQTQDDLTACYSEAIGSAKHSITFVIYALTDRAIVEALKERSNAGIPVYLVCDAQASKGIRQLNGKNVTIVRRAGPGLTHQKILIVDEQKIYIGSANMTGDSLRLHGNLITELDNASLASAMTTKIKGMDEDARAISLPPQYLTMGEQPVEFWDLPEDPSAANRIKELIRTAKKTIKVAMFTWTRQDFTKELIKAANRGVDVQVVIDRYSGKGASAKIVKMLADGGIDVRLSIGQGLLHHKFAWIDDDILINGSANWTLSAFTKNDDCFLIISSLTQAQNAKMVKLWRVIRTESEPVRK